MYPLNIIRETTKQFLTTIEALQQLSVADLTKKSSEQAWSIFDILEHLLIVEKYRVGSLAASVKQSQGQVTSRPSHVNFNSNEELWEKASHRKHKTQAPDYARPQGNLKSLAQFVAEFSEVRNKMEYILTNYTQHQLHNTYLEHGRMGYMHAEEWLVYLCGHAEKHHQQIKELLQLP